MNEKRKFVINTIFQAEENKNVEFKHINSKKVVSKAASYTEECVIAFLNASVEGDLYIGIKDSGEILGIQLTRSERDEVHKNIPNTLRNSHPSVLPSQYDIETHSVLDSSFKEIEDLKIVQIHVYKLEEKDLFRTISNQVWLYRTKGGSIYQRTGSNCFKLNNSEIDRELKERYQKGVRKEIEVLNKKIKEEPEKILLWEEKAKLSRLIEDVEAMDEAYKKLLQLNSENSSTIIKQAFAHESLGDSEGALSILDKAMSADRKNPKFFSGKAKILTKLNRDVEALDSYREALKLNPDNYTVMTQIGILLREMSKYSEAIKIFNLALSKAPKYRVAKYEKDRTYQMIFSKTTRD